MKATDKIKKDGKREETHALARTEVYVYRFPFETVGGDIYPPERKKEIEESTHPAVKAQKFYVWKLLEFALSCTFGLKIEEIRFAKSGGKWTCGACEFSLSHSGNLVAVALSHKPIGVDIEAFTAGRFCERLIKKIATESEFHSLLALPKEARETAACKLWTQKEAAFKQFPAKTFSPAKIEVSAVPCRTVALASGGKQYFLTVASPDCAEAIIRTHEVTLIEE